ncbi:penicillin-binding protein 2 [Dialister micraerophilus]|uniref:Penicillin-binding protein 2 n=1 Tax=Dialister micraerophilus UPII 345-E TaxID=910314 RepID=E4L885_9FIRM|nr:penicillin-binding protein 2 [Dialister micraerophilus]EFR43042.1 penicillin-binding protein 2 [Dialister micraerophilus UPII 345-E]
MNRKHVPLILESLLKKREESRYSNLIYTAVILICILGLRLFFMQVIDASYYKSEADGNRIRHLPVQAARGVIYDRNGIVLAGSKSSYSITIPVDRQGIQIKDEELKKISDLVHVSVDDLKKRIEDYKSNFGAIYLVNNVGVDVATQIEERKDEFPGIEIEIAPIRIYPFKSAGAQILGYVGEAGNEDRDKNGNPYKSSAIIGRAGLEQKYNQYLEGKNGVKKVEVDAAGHPVRYITGEEVVSGQNIRLTIDAKLQKAAEDAVEAQVEELNGMGVSPTGASVIAVDPNTGAVLAMVSWPTYDPNMFSRGIKSSEWNYIINNKNHPLQDRAVSSMYAPGSIFKVITAATALESKVMMPDEKIYDNGKHWIIDKRNAEGEAFGWIDFYDAMAKSDNVYFYEMGRRTGIDRLSKMAGEFGLGKKTGIDLDGESEGNVASEEYKLKVFHQDWYLGETFDASIGQSYTLTTPIQMAMVYSAIANGGVRYKPYVVSRIDNLDGTPMKIFAPVSLGSIPVSKTNLGYISEALRKVMTKEGTGGFIFNNYPIPIAGKSGTAETNGGENGWFIAYAPFDKPEIVVVAFFEHSGFGSQSAAPVVKKMMDAYFHIGDYAKNKKKDYKIDTGGN